MKVVHIAYSDYGGAGTLPFGNGDAGQAPLAAIAGGRRDSDGHLSSAWQGSSGCSPRRAGTCHRYHCSGGMAEHLHPQGHNIHGAPPHPRSGRLPRHHCEMI